MYNHNGGTFEILETATGELVGTVAVLKISDSTGKVRKMYVHKTHRQKGYGQLLLDRIIERAIRLNFKELILETVHSMTAAISLYEKNGFKKLDNHFAASPRCDIVMAKNLKEKNK